MIIQLKNIGKKYHRAKGYKWIFRNINWSIKLGERWALMGRNGSGKSSLMRILSKAEDPSEGSVVHFGRVSWPLAFGGGFQGGLTGADNIRFIARLYGLDEKESVKKAQEFAEIGEEFFEPFKYYSSGMRARLAFAASLLVDFDCILIDEIVAVGDAYFAKRCENTLMSLKDKTIVLISHDINTVLKYCKTAAVLKDGKLYLHDDVKCGIEQYLSDK